ncbi:membrane hypothetical protein [Burkholderia diffusa]|nr:membrane hypothetical protein [Burkholderia diffusa]
MNSQSLDLGGTAGDPASAVPSAARAGAGATALPARGVTLGEFMDDLPVGALHRFVVWVIGVGLFFDMYEIFLVSTIGSALQNEYGLSRQSTDFKLLLASAFIGMFVGAMCLGSLADRIGRRKAFLLTLVWYSAFSLIGAFSVNADMPVPDGHRRRRDLPGRRQLPVGNPAEGQARAVRRLGLYDFVRRGAAGRLPRAVAESASYLGCGRLAHHPRDRQPRRGLRAAGPASAAGKPALAARAGPRRGCACRGATLRGQRGRARARAVRGIGRTAAAAGPRRAHRAAAPPALRRALPDARGIPPVPGLRLLRFRHARGHGRQEPRVRRHGQHAVHCAVVHRLSDRLAAVHSAAELDRAPHARDRVDPVDRRVRAVLRVFGQHGADRLLRFPDDLRVERIQQRVSRVPGGDFSGTCALDRDRQHVRAVAHRQRRAAVHAAAGAGRTWRRHDVRRDLGRARHRCGHAARAGAADLPAQPRRHQPGMTRRPARGMGMRAPCIARAARC